MKIVFITFHNWITKRQGGFHKLAEAASKAGHEVIFFSAQRPYFICLKHEERLNPKVLSSLRKGIKYDVDEGKSLINCTWPTLRIPQPLYSLLPAKVNNWFSTHSFIPFKSFCKKFLAGSEIFVFESCDGLDLYDKIKQYFPLAKVIYRPSDPLMVGNVPKEIMELEMHVLKSADINLIVNKAGVELYRNKIPQFDEVVKYRVLPNGVSVNDYRFRYDCPEILKLPNTFLYVGARIPEWKLIIKAAQTRTNYNFVIVCPEYPTVDLERFALPNLFYIPGISPKDVPGWITNCDVVIVPNPKNIYKQKPWGITAKYYQAMTAKKPIVAYEDTSELLEYNVHVAYNDNEFIEMLDKAIIQGETDYSYKLHTWEKIGEDFMDIINSI